MAKESQAGLKSSRLSLLSAGVRGEHRVRRSPILLTYKQLCMFSVFEVQLYFSMHLV